VCEKEEKVHQRYSLCVAERIGPPNKQPPEISSVEIFPRYPTKDISTCRPSLREDEVPKDYNSNQQDDGQINDYTQIFRLENCERFWFPFQ
jgi:hypothetical protein